MRIDKPDYLKLMAIVAPALANLYAANDEQNNDVIGENMSVENDLAVYYDFVTDLFDDIRDKIVNKAEEEKKVFDNSSASDTTNDSEKKS